MPSNENTPLLPFPDAPAPATLTPEEDATAAFTRYEKPEPPRWRRYTIHLGLFLLTLLTTTLAGFSITAGRLDVVRLDLLWQLPVAQWHELLVPGLWFSVPFLGVLTVHEFGHYCTARFNRIRATLPYFLPFPMGIGTFGAVIRIKDRIFSRREFFDVGLAGPLAGFVVAVGVLVYGLTHLPPLGSAPETDAIPAQPLLFQLLAAGLADPARMPPPSALMHYPVLMAGILALFFTALNLLPIGQLDGGHILYGLLGPRRAGRLSAAFFVAFIFYAGLGLFSLQSSSQTWLYWAGPYALYLVAVFWRVLPTRRRGLMLALAVWLAQVVVASVWPGVEGNPAWLVFGLLLGRVTGVYHPSAPDERPLSRGRLVLGWLMLAIFVLCFTPTPFLLR